MSNTPQTRDALIEALADIEHQRWGDWQKWVHQRCVEEPSTDEFGTHPLTIPAITVRHWERLIATPYADLPEHGKQSDRDQVARYLPLIVAFVAEWIGREGGRFAIHEPDVDEMVHSWRDAMTRPEAGTVLHRWHAGHDPHPA